MGIRDKEFREGNAKTLSEAVGKRLEHGANKGQNNQSTKVQRGKRTKRSEMVLIHEAYQYLLKRKTIQQQQVRNKDLKL